MEREQARTLTPEVISNLTVQSVANIPSLADVFVHSMKGKTAILTGGATGLGYNVTNRLAEAGANVVIASRSPQKGEKAEKEFREKGYEVSFCPTDVTDVEACRRAVAFAEKKYGKVDILVANAATWSMYSYLDMPEEEFDAVLNCDLKGEYFMGQAAARSMVKNKVQGKIIFIASTARKGCDVNGVAMMTHYNAAKGAISSMTIGIAKELKQYGISVNCVAPGGMLSTGTITNTAKLGALYGPEALADRSKYSAESPTTMNPDEVALVVFGMCTPMSNFMSGETVDVNGGVQLSYQKQPWSYTVEGCKPGPQKNG